MFFISDLIRNAIDADLLKEALTSAIADCIDYDELAAQILDAVEIETLIEEEARNLIEVSPF